jgi:hypothetical protein
MNLGNGKLALAQTSCSRTVVGAREGSWVAWSHKDVAIKLGRAEYQYQANWEDCERTENGESIGTSLKDIRAEGMERMDTS